MISENDWLSNQLNNMRQAVAAEFDMFAMEEVVCLFLSRERHFQVKVDVDWEPTVHQVNNYYTRHTTQNTSRGTASPQ